MIKLRIIIFLLSINLLINYYEKKELFFSKEKQTIKIYDISKIFNYEINKAILIFETNDYHYECTPGYAKYFLDLGFNIDIIMSSYGKDSFSLFFPTQKVRIFIFDNIMALNNNIKNLLLLFNKYDYILIQTAEPKNKILYKKFTFFERNNTIFILHHINYAKPIGIHKYFKQNRLWSLGNFHNVLQVNPHFFGYLKLKDKNSKTKFFITSTIGRNYTFLKLAVEKLNKEQIDFEVIVIGKTREFDPQKIKKNLKKHFKFKFQVSYYELYQSVEQSDYIIINLDPNNKNDIDFKNIRITGSLQLSYGFLKPPIINKNFANIYNLNNKNSFIYDDNQYFYKAMKEAIMANNQEYRKMQKNLIRTSNNIYKFSLNNIKKTIKHY